MHHFIKFLHHSRAFKGYLPSLVAATLTNRLPPLWQDHMSIATDEIFGPVQSILKFSTVEEVCSSWAILENPDTFRI